MVTKLQTNDLCKAYVFCDKDMIYKEYVCLVLEDEKEPRYDDFHYNIDFIVDYIDVLIENKILAIEIQDLEKY